MLVQLHRGEPPPGSPERAGTQEEGRLQSADPTWTGNKIRADLIDNTDLSHVVRASKLLTEDSLLHRAGVQLQQPAKECADREAQPEALVRHLSLHRRRCLMV